MICPNCQKPNKRNAKFCKHCGVPLPQKLRVPVEKLVLVAVALVSILLLGIALGRFPFPTPTPITATPAPTPSAVVLILTPTPLPTVAPTATVTPTVVVERRLDLSATDKSTLNVTDFDNMRVKDYRLLFRNPGTVSGDIWSAAWSEDGKEILVSYSWYSTNYDNGSALFLLNPATQVITTVVKTEPVAQGLPAARAFRDGIWLGKGDKIAVRYQYGGDFGIWTMNRDGTEFQRLASSDVSDWPRFSTAGGEWLIAVSSTDNQLYALRIDGQTRKPLEESKDPTLTIMDQRYFGTKGYLGWRGVGDPTSEFGGHPYCTLSRDWFLTAGAFWNCEWRQP